MELFEARDHYIIQNGEQALWCSRLDGSLTARRGSDICSAWNPVCLGTLLGIIGKMKTHSDSEWKLLLVRQHHLVGMLPCGAEIYKITKIAILPLCQDEPKELELELCRKHHFGLSRMERMVRQPDSQAKSLAKTWNSIKSAAENVKPRKREVRWKEKLEKRMLEELSKMFTDSDSFYYCPGGDLTNTVQRQAAAKVSSKKQKAEEGGERSGHEVDASQEPAWTQADDRFFWNRYMLQDLISAKDPLADPWITPIIQGYVQIERCISTYDDDLDTVETGSDIANGNGLVPLNMKEIAYKLCLISRRSRYRAGTRYKRRGVDEQGYCANYIETEQILEFNKHVVSFVQVRGSVPLYWSQTGIKYKPPPIIDRDESENQAAFVKHFDHQVALYRNISVVNVVDGTGKEKVIADAYLHHTILYNSSQLVYIAFDFHEYCRGMKFENVSILTDNVMDVIKDMRYCWVDPNGMICDQRGVFRVNCIDCLDRTNIVQSAIARIVLEVQCRKLGLLAPEEQLPDACRLTFQQMWANNGDIISQQYAGTPALKGDYTRTGERKFSGLMKDGMNSANRYYINRVKDVYRQATIDLMLGHDLQADELSALALSGSVRPEQSPEDSEVEKEQNLRTLIEESRRMLLCEGEECLGAWGLIDCDPATGDPTQQDTDIILLLSQHAYYVANYDDDIDQVISYQKIHLKDLDKVEIGNNTEDAERFAAKVASALDNMTLREDYNPENPAAEMDSDTKDYDCSRSPSPSLFKSKYMCIRIYYTTTEGCSHFHALRTTNTRLFNNIIVHIHNDEEARESLKAIAETFVAAKKLMSQDLPFVECKLDRKRTRPHAGIINIAQQAQEQVTTLQRGATGLTGRASTSTSLSQQAGPQSRSDVLTSRLGRTFASFNPVRRIRLGRIKPNVAQFIPAVLYNKDDAPTDGSTEQARILKGEKVVVVPGAAVSRNADKVMTLKRDYDLDDIADALEDVSDDLDDDIDTSMWPWKGDTHVDFHLLSCGIVRTSPVASASSLMHGRASQMSSDRNVVQVNTSRWHNCDQRYRSDTLYDAHTRTTLKGENLPSTYPVAFSLEADIEVESDRINAFPQTEDNNEPPGGSIDVEASIPVNTTRQSHKSTDNKHDEWVNISVDDAALSTPSRQHLFQPCMKMSFSEGSLSGMSPDFCDSQGSDTTNAASPLSRLRSKMSSLTGGAALGARTKLDNRQQSRQLVNFALQNRINSELRFRQIHTKIILL